jgi:Rrf2 family protein
MTTLRHASTAARCPCRRTRVVSTNSTTAEQLARAQNIPARFLETILTHLRRSNIVRSQRGPDGGFWLARPAAEISLADVIRAADGVAIDLALGTDGERAALESLTVADMGQGDGPQAGS